MDGGTLGVYRVFGSFECEYGCTVIKVVATDNDATCLIHFSDPFKRVECRVAVEPADILAVLCYNDV